MFTRRAHPLVLFLDDMQWADPESIQLLKLVAMSEGTEAFLLIEAFRDNEVSDGHPLHGRGRASSRKHRRVTRLDLAPLPIAEIARAGRRHAAPRRRRRSSRSPAWCAARPTATRSSSASSCSRSTRPATSCSIPGSRRFTFDAASIERAPISENVADLLADSLRKLPPSTQHVLAMAAAIGNRFELELLALVAGASPVVVHAELTAALDQELVVPLSELEYVAAPGGSGLVFRRLRFQHDRIQRAAYALMSPRRPAAHAPADRRAAARPARRRPSSPTGSSTWSRT